MADARLEAAATSLHGLMERDERWFCPIFQRRYAWGKKEVDTLWQDIDAVLGSEPQSRSRFLGAILIDVASPSSAGRTQENWLVDGQQRLTTFYLLVCAVLQLLEGVQGNPEPPTATAEDLAFEYLFGTKAFNRFQPRLRPTLQDTAQFNEVLRGFRTLNAKLPPDFGPRSGKLTQAFLRIKEGVSERCSEEPSQELSPDRLRGFLEDVMDRLSLVEIQLGEDHNAYEVFERLNTSGKDLEAADLVRNFVFHRAAQTADVATVQSVYDHDWIPLERSFRDQASFEGFFFPFALILKPQITKSNMFHELSSRWTKETEGLNGIDAAKAVIGDLQEFVDAFNAISGFRTTSAYPKELRQATQRIARMPAPTVAYPYLMRVLREFEQDGINAEAATAALTTIEGFLVRRAVKGLEPTGLHAVFKKLYSDAGASPQAIARTIDENATITYPDDREFATAVQTGDLYHRRLARFIIEEYERSIAKGNADEGMTIDHVVPQVIRGEWRDLFTARQHQQWVHTWANLVPLSSSNNSTKGTRSWANARDRLRNETHYKTTKLLLEDYSSWTVDSLQQRANELSKWAVKRWPKPKY